MFNQKEENTGGLLVVKRLDPSSSFFVKEGRTPSVRLTHEEVLNRYRGFEGDLWPNDDALEKIQLVNGLAPIAQFDIVLSYYQRLSKEFLCDFLYLSFLENVILNELPSYPFNFCGYDFGYIDEYDCFSELYNEIIYGSYDELRAHARDLNANLLFSSLDFVKELKKTRSQLLAQGADIEAEDGEDFLPIAIFGFVKKIGGIIGDTSHISSKFHFEDGAQT